MTAKQAKLLLLLWGAYVQGAALLFVLWAFGWKAAVAVFLVWWAVNNKFNEMKE